MDQERVFCRVLSAEKAGNGGRGASGRTRVTVTLDNGESFTVSAKQAADLGLMDGAALSEEQYTGTMKKLGALCMQRCGTLLQGRDYPELRLREKLLLAGFPVSSVEDCVRKLKEAGYLDDRRYAENYVRVHFSDKSRGRIRQDLAARGIAEDLIDEAFREVGREEDLEKAQRDQIARLLRKRGYDPSAASFADKQKVMAFLHRKGFRPDLIRQAADGMEPAPGE